MLLAVPSNSSGLSLPLPLLLVGMVLAQLDCGNDPDGGRFCIVCECCIAGG